MRSFVIATALLAVPLAAGEVRAADPDSCKVVRLSDPGWSDISATNGVLGTILKPLGYQAKIDTLAVPVTYRSLGDGQIDAFLGNWMPAQAKFIQPLKDEGKIQIVRENLNGIRFTLAVPDYVAEEGVHTVDDLQKYADKFDHRIYGIESGAPVNQNIQAAIKAGDYGLSGWQLVESGEQAMLAQVDRAERRKAWVAFVAWEPHPMNTRFKLTYLSGGEKTFGPNYGASNVFTVARKNFAADCPNVDKLLSQMQFSVPMENELMEMAASGKTPDVAGAVWLKAHPDIVKTWLAGITTFDGRDGLPPVEATLGLN
jgi:glycine betaine/proline transport system substrate-binding protein